MSKSKTKIMSLFCVFAMIFSMFSTGIVVHAEENGSIELVTEASTVIVSPDSSNEAFNVDVVITENPGIVCIGFVLPDELLTNFDVVVSDGDVFQGFQTVGGSSNHWAWDDIMSSENYTNTGVVLKLSLTPKNGITSGTYNIGVNLSQDDTLGNDGITPYYVPFNIIPCSVSVVQSTDIKSISAEGTIYYDGSAYTTGSGFRVTATLYDGSTKELSSTEYSISGTDSTAIITYTGSNYIGEAPKATVNTTAKEATAITLNPTTVSATVGDTKESIASKVKYTARYNDGSTSEEKQVTAAMLGDIDLSTPGQKTVTVTAEGRTATLTVDVTEHTHTPGEVQGTNKDATCTEPGSIQYWVCSICNQMFADEACTQPIETDVIPPLEHSLTHHPEVPATCTSDGTEEYWECERCTLLFSDAEGKNNISTPETITRLGHNLVKHEEVPATCTTAGTEAYWSCSRCGKLFSDENGAVEIASPTEITALGHHMTHHEAIPSTCIVNGQIEYWSCDRCGKNFVDAEGNTVAETLVAPLASHTLTETKAVPPTTTASGNEAFWTCSVCNQMFADETGSNKLDTIPVIPSLGETVEATTPQTSVNDTTVEAAVQTISNQIDALLPEGYTATVNVAEGGYTAPVAGTADNPKGTAGSITYTVTITSDTDASDTVTTEAKTLTITAQEYVAPSAPSYTITVSGAYADKTTAKAGETVTVTAPYRYGYRFAGWYTSSNLDLPDRSPVSFVMPNGNVTIEAVYTHVIYYPTVDYDPPLRPSRPESEPNEVEDGWHGDQYYLDGEPVTGWLEIEHGEWYYFDRTGSMVTGWELVDNTWYYMYDSGVMATGWVKVDGSWYFLKSSGAMATGWLWVDNNWYYLSGSGAMKTGWVYVGNKWYFLKSSGAMATGWLEWNGNWYYLNNPNGDMAVDTRTPDGYYVNSDGIWVR